MYLFYTILFCAGLAIYALDGHTIAKEVVITKYRRFRELNKLVQTRYQTIGMILWVSLNMVAKMYWLNFLHWANNSIEHIDHKTVIVSYVINGKLYRMVERTKRGPTNVLLVIDQDSNDVSDTILPFMGPNQDWHGREFIPSFWGKQSLTFELASGEQKTFTTDEIIKLEN
jgi:hypothetical protein